MADALDDAEFWLPSQFLSDDDWLLEKEYMKTVNSGNSNRNNCKGYAQDMFGAPYNFPTDLSSPVESVSTETESDEDDYGLLAGLTHQMARSTLHADELTSLTHGNLKGWSTKPVSHSPQSTLCQVGAGYGYEYATSCVPTNGLSNSKACSASPQATWDLLYAAAGKVAKINLDEEMSSNGIHDGREIFLKGRSRNHYSQNQEHKTNQSIPDIDLYKLLAFKQLRQQQLLKLRRQHQEVAWGVHGGAHMHHHQNNRCYQGRNINGENTVTGGYGLSPIWPQLNQTLPELQKQSQMGMRAVLLANPPAKKGRSGTGVFLPRRVVTPVADTRRKSSNSTVPMQSVMAQNCSLNLDEALWAQQLHSRRPADNDVVDSSLRSANILGGSHVKRSFKSSLPVMSNEVGLPQEWTY